ncbi:MAG TPA: peptide deformylase [Tepidisphaeraceae bacterium]|jgi:peptide deformylase|nr:peptide deformylase [Tepidisphaeraceae bacterium]
MFEDLQIIHYPDPRLRKVSETITAFDDRLAALVAKMFELMRASKGVGLAAPQVGENIRLFVANPTGEPGDDRIYVNPILSEPDGGDEEGEEGCLSLPEINAKIMRTKTMRIDAQNLRGEPFSDTQSGYIARIWQHEFDHLNGTMIIDRMGALAKMAAKKTLKELEETYAENKKKQ